MDDHIADAEPLLLAMSSELSRPLLAADKGVRQGGSMLKMRRRELDFLFDSHDLYRTIKESLVARLLASLSFSA